ncbi:MAG: glutaredoxin family protein [Candidatus Rokubacteria bacterium]|nr:glutaredoxin family protein [Candidatus Rokubacteria bacterium]
MPHVEIYGKRDCCLCDEAKATLRRVQADIPFELREIDIESAPDLYAAMSERIPLVMIDGRLAFKYRVDETALRRRLSARR